MRTKESTPVSPTCSATVIVSSAIGLHARPAAVLVKTTQQYTAEVMIESGGVSVNAKSILGVVNCHGSLNSVIRV